MKVANNILYKVLSFACALMLIVACNDDTTFTGEGETVPVTFHPTMVGTRTIGDAANIDKLTVVAYDENNSEKIRLEKSWSDAQSGVTLTLIEGRTYSILFWAHSEACNAYTIGEGGKISVDYSSYKDGGFAKMEQMDAFYATAEITVSVANSNNNPVELTRPFAQLNFADKTTEPVKDTHKTVVTFHSIPTAFNPFDGTVETSNSETTFTFADYDILTGERLPVKNDDNTYSSYYYLSSNYIFVPANSTLKLPVTIDLQLVDGTSVNKHEFKNEKAIELLKNHKTNVAGAIVQQPETWSVWDGTTKTEPGKDAQNRYIIDEASDIAWLSANGASIAAGTFLQTKDIDMNNAAIASISLPAGSTYDGGNMQIINYKNSLFGDATNLNVQNLIVDNITATGTTHVGALVNTLKGSSSFTNVQVTNATATTTNGAAGGVVGYISRTGSEALNVTFDDCHVTETTIDGTTCEGHFVGLLRGYDNNEVLEFKDNCTLTLSQTATVASDFVSPYREGNEGAWLATRDYSKFNGWLGDEEFYRGKVYYGDKTADSNRFVPCWDGAKKVTPLKDSTDGTTWLIYSPFDLANLQGSNPGSIKFMENVDLGAKVFNPLTNLSKLIGENRTVYNMKVETTFNTNSWDGGGFVRRCSAATIENITFKDADVKVTHATGSDGDAYASIVCGTAEGTNTMTNVKVVGGKLYGCNKMGGIAGYITGTFKATNCSVDGLSIENYDSGGKDKLGFKANGEVGGAFGFIAANSTIEGCYVKNTTLNCIGVNNGRVLVLFKYAGRHVNEFIGDIRTTSGQTITIKYDANNFTGNTYKNRKDQYSGCEYIGHCYYTSINAVLAKIEDTKGTVYVNDKSITVAKNY